MEFITHFQVPSDVDIDIEFIDILYDKKDINIGIFRLTFFSIYRKLQLDVSGLSLKVNSTHFRPQL